ncbi:MAG: nucleotidyl transferase AbiEii/AbiGii toxin family protein [bacterium]
MAQKKLKLHWEILDKKRIDLLPKLKFLKDAGFYLAGGTALALQIKHRTSVDFDFYSENDFDSQKIHQLFQSQNSKKLLVDTITENTLIIEIDNISISLFTYKYPLLKPFIISDELQLASLEDIAAMKLIAIIQRGVKRDFIDLYFLSQIFGLGKIMNLTNKKYAGFNKYLACQALVYFKDAEDDKKQKREIEMIAPIEWEDVKKYFLQEVNKLKAQWAQNEN